MSTIKNIYIFSFVWYLFVILNIKKNSKENFFFFSSRRRHTRSKRDWSSDVCSSDLFHRRMSIHLRGRERGVTQQLLYRPQIGAGVEQVRGERMAQGVNVQVAAARQGAQQPPDRELHAPRREPPPPPAHEHRPAVERSGEARAQGVAPPVVAAQRASRVAPDRNEPLLLPLAAHFHLVRDQVHVRLVQPRQLGEADARRVEQLEHGEIPRLREPARRRPALRLGEHLLDLGAVEERGERALELRRARRLRGVHLQPARRMQESVERPQRRERAGGRALAEAALLHRPQPAADRQAIHAREAPPARVVARAERGEVGHVARIRLHRVRRVVPLFFEEGDEVGDLGDWRHDLTPSLPLSAWRRGGRGVKTRAAKASMSASARSTSCSLFFCLSFTGRSSGSSNPKFAFIGWKCAGSALCTYRYNAPSIVVGGGTTGASPASSRARLIPARIPVAADSV